LSYFLSTRWGGDESDAKPERMREVLAELATEDDEHPSVALTHESEWSLGAYTGGLLVWENVGDDTPPRHLNGVSAERVLGLWQKLAAGRVAEIEAEPWLAGYEDAE
jgi:hypothetical protein